MADVPCAFHCLHCGNRSWALLGTCCVEGLKRHLNAQIDKIAHLRAEVVQVSAALHWTEHISWLEPGKFHCLRCLKERPLHTEACPLPALLKLAVEKVSHD